jgi:2-polyprenyl-3-methyl-5-hydroxy-6-metoxy-1,4-benzoquinol methylase
MKLLRTIWESARPQTQETMEARRAKFPLDFDLADDQRWNHSIQYHRVLIEAIPRGATHILDVGCGEGLLVRQLKRNIPTLTVTGIDPDPISIDRARKASPNEPSINYICDDIRAHTFSPGSFDAVVSINTIHHMDIAEALRCFSQLVKPGGTIGIIGVPRRRLIADSPFYIWMFLGHLFRILPRQSWDHGAPVLLPKETAAEVRRIVHAVLPGAKFRRRVLARYTVIWHKPN